MVHESRTHVTLALDRASISDGLWTVPGPGGDTPLTIICVGWGH
ncbi:MULTISPECIES: hypothetical protein [Rothia]|nr:MULTISPECIES: hypothetical protein [Rothia]